MDDVLWSLRFSLNTLVIGSKAVVASVGVLLLTGHPAEADTLTSWIIDHIEYWELLHG